MSRKKSIYDEFDEVVYLLPGGGSLGSFQVGAIAALEENGYLPDWVSGISIGAINAAIYAGNPPDTRLDQLRTFWDKISHHTFDWIDYFLNPSARRLMSGNHSILMGQENFFVPNAITKPLPYRTTPNNISFYDVTPLRDTLEKLIDFDYLNSHKLRLSIGAVDIATGMQVFFDNTKSKLDVRHVLASSALPPAFPAVEIDGRYYWDGGLYSNTPVHPILMEKKQKSRLAFVFNLFHPSEKLPETIDEVLERKKDIEYANQMDSLLCKYTDQVKIHNTAQKLINQLPDEILADERIQKIIAQIDLSTLHIASIEYPVQYTALGSCKDYDFSHASIKQHCELGYKHTLHVINKSEWWVNPNQHYGSLLESDTVAQLL